jgi:hypothetical protein
MKWEKGRSANPGGRPKHDREFTEALRVAVHRTDKDGKKALYRLADKLVACALEDGHGWAFAQIADRLEGKPNQQIDHTINDFREISEFSDAELTEMLKERVVLKPIDDKPRQENEPLN